MALSEREQELLSQLEKQLSDDPAFTSSIPVTSEPQVFGAVPQVSSPRNLARGALIAVIGLGVIIAGVATKLIIVGVLGFLMAAGGVYFATLKPKTPVAAGQKSPSSQKSPKSGFMQNLENKWDERQGGPRI